MEIQSGHSELSIISQLSTVEGCPLSRIPLYVIELVLINSWRYKVLDFVCLYFLVSMTWQFTCLFYWWCIPFVVLICFFSDYFFFLLLFFSSHSFFRPSFVRLPLFFNCFTSRMAGVSALVNNWGLGAGFVETLLKWGIVKYLDIKLGWSKFTLSPRGVEGVGWNCGVFGVVDVFSSRSENQS